MKEEIKFSVKGIEWEKLQEEAFEKVNKKAKIDGFRPGKAPRNIYEKKYGKQVKYVNTIHLKVVSWRHFLQLFMLLGYSNEK